MIELIVVLLIIWLIVLNTKIVDLKDSLEAAEKKLEHCLSQLSKLEKKLNMLGSEVKTPEPQKEERKVAEFQEEKAKIFDEPTDSKPSLSENINPEPINIESNELPAEEFKDNEAFAWV